jgi:DNA-binding NtrC family response regulator
MTPNHPSGAVTVRMAGRVVVHSRSAQSCEQLAQACTRQGYEVLRATSVETLQSALQQDSIAACILDEPESTRFVEAVAASIREFGQITQVIVLPPLGVRPETLAVRGIADVLEPPHTPERIGRALFAAVGRSRLLAENQQLKQDLDGRMWPDLIGHTAAMGRVRTELRAVVDDQQPVLVMGEPGTGATFVARAIHTVRCGDSQELVTLRCNVMSAAAAEAALFGDGTNPAGSGKLIAGIGTTLLLDDVEGLPLSVQSQLARALAQAATAPEGSRPHVLATTHADLRKQASQGQFEPALLRQLSAHCIQMPTLRDRRQDVGALAAHFLAEVAAREGLPMTRLTTEALDCLHAYAWPGNVRELENVIARCCTLDPGATLTAAMITPWLEGECSAPAETAGLSLREMERKLIEATFNRFHGNRELTARALKIGLRTLSGKLREYGYPPRGGPGSNRQVRAA